MISHSAGRSGGGPASDQRDRPARQQRNACRGHAARTRSVSASCRQFQSESLLNVSSSVKRQKIVLTQKRMAGHTIQELQLEACHGVVITTVTRGEVEMLAAQGLELRFGDVLQVVGPEEGLRHAANALGNSVHALDETHFVPLFGIGIGILLAGPARSQSRRGCRSHCDSVWPAVH